MDKKQLQMDLDIVKKELQSFSLAMCDRWNNNDYDYNRRLNKELKELYDNYQQTYHTEPLYKSCRYHDDVIALRDRLTQELKGE